MIILLGLPVSSFELYVPLTTHGKEYQMDASMETTRAQAARATDPDGTAIGMVNTMRENIDQAHSILSGLVERMGYSLHPEETTSPMPINSRDATPISPLVDDLRTANEDVIRLQNRLAELKQRCTL